MVKNNLILKITFLKKIHFFKFRIWPQTSKNLTPTSKILTPVAKL
jgi:hypothetical protein